MLPMLKSTANMFKDVFIVLAECTISPLAGLTECSRDFNAGQTFILWVALGLPALLATLIFSIFTVLIAMTGISIGAFIACLVAALGDCVNLIVDACRGNNAMAYQAAEVVETPHHAMEHDIENPHQPYDFDGHQHAIPSSTSMVQNALQLNAPVATERTLTHAAFTDYTRSYLESFANKLSHQETISSMQLTEDEMNLLVKYNDPITMMVMNIPVTLNEKVYDLASLERILANTGLDPLNGLKFTAAEITPARQVNQQILNTLNLIKDNRKHAENAGLRAPVRSRSMSDLEEMEMTRIGSKAA